MRAKSYHVTSDISLLPLLASLLYYLLCFLTGLRNPLRASVAYPRNEEKNRAAGRPFKLHAQQSYIAYTEGKKELRTDYKVAL